MKRKLFCTLLVLTLVLFAGLSTAMAAAVPSSKEIEETRNYESDTLRITIEQWCYKYNRTSLRFFVADVYMTRPDQMHDRLLLIAHDFFRYVHPRRPETFRRIFCHLLQRFLEGHPTLVPVSAVFLDISAFLILSPYPFYCRDQGICLRSGPYGYAVVFLYAFL